MCSRPILRSSVEMMAWAFGFALFLVPVHSAVAQGDDVAYLKQRVFRIPIEVASDKGDAIRELRLFVSSDQGKTWTRVATVNPSQRSFTFRARVDGEYWFGLSYVDASGRAEPEDMRNQPPGLKVIVDTTMPVLKLRPIDRSETSAGLHWEVVDDFPVELSSLKMEIRGKREGSWRDLYPEAMLEGEIEWPASMNEGFIVRASVEDRAGNIALAEIDLPGAGPTAEESNTIPAAPIANPSAEEPMTAGGSDFRVPPPPSIDDMVQPGPPSMAGTQPTAPSAELAPRSEPAAVAHTVAKPVYEPSPSRPVTDSADERFVAVPKPMDRPMNPEPARDMRPAPPMDMVASTAMPVRPAMNHVVKKQAPPPERIPLVGETRFAVDYALRGIGPAGVGKVELFYTKDHGVVWTLLGEDADRTPPFEVDLPGEGRYGLAIVVTSPAGNGQRPPQAGDVPTVQVEVDTTAPEAELYRPVPDPASPNDSMLIRWSARDSHLGDRPVRLYYSPAPEGPWEPISTDLPAVGEYSWRVPPRTPFQVFLKLGVADLCSNESVAVTPEPVLVDLSRPEAEVIGIAILPSSSVTQ